MADSAQLRDLASDDLSAAIALARSLPEWFNHRGLEQMAVDLHHQRGAVVEANGEFVGFVTWFSRAGVGEIGWIAIAPDHHRRGYGAPRRELAEDRHPRAGAPQVRVATLGESV
ncbi:MAG: GNAT family N-acetyltransferase, partial [Actinomycetota bacterium]